jgi:hypothetical protein
MKPSSIPPEEKPEAHRKHWSDRRLRRGVQRPDGVTLGIGLTCPSPELAQVCAHAGFDVVLIT